MNEFERHVFTLPRLARPRHAHDTLAHTHARAPCSRTNALCKLRAELDRVFARLRPHKVDSASEPPSLPFRHVLCPRTPPSHGTCSRMRPCLTTVCLDIPCGGAGQGGPAAQASTTCVWSPHNWSHACYNHCCAVFSLVLRGGNCLVATRGAAGAVGVYGARSSSAKPAL
jgi:hypothetical protein